MSQITSAPDTAELAQLAKLSVSIRGKLQFMDYLVRAAVADIDRYHEEGDAGTRIFIRQLIEMHAANLTVESENMRLVGDLCHTLESILQDSQGHDLDHDLDHDHDHDSAGVRRNGDSE
jgi:hypothetical protein